MASRAIRKTSLNFGLVNVAVGVRKLVDSPSKDTALHLGTPDGNKPVQKYLDTVTGAIYGVSELPHGVYDDYANGVGFHEVPADAIEAIDEACEIDGLVIDGFIPVADIPRERIESSYFLAPDGGPIAAKYLALVRDAMASEDVAGIGKCTLSKKQRPFVVYTEGKAVILVLLTFAAACVARVEEAQGVLGDVATDPKTLGLAKTLIDGLMVESDHLDTYVDESIAQREALIMAAAEGQTITVPEKGVAAVAEVDLEAVLLASIGSTPKAKAGKPAAKKQPAVKQAA